MNTHPHPHASTRNCRCEVWEGPYESPFIRQCWDPDKWTLKDYRSIFTGLFLCHKWSCRTRNKCFSITNKVIHAWAVPVLSLLDARAKGQLQLSWRHHCFLIGQTWKETFFFTVPTKIKNNGDRNEQGIRQSTGTTVCLGRRYISVGIF